MPLRMTLTMQVGREDADEFITRFQSAADYAAGVPGCLGQAITANNLDTETTEFVITSEWTDRESFHRFETSEDQDRVTAPLAALRRSARMELAEIGVQL
ncbi:antibiotic biosynthesis monooxygenase family protein [Amycolatopsis sp. H20-H5]|uniref:antibiotic biosynthesis monooxygenase family protein n=1 Tax=Amycolatopsis sp. H20-H5 TaxID=3046309 RepID=UPI002DBAE414|nr:antibiotic biosynthesis monooxygenase family protein [Amycolatopsis sp. H20-H5]MEC3974260.1 antibiotic biosynthesis monooxygenase family protein [Amycolatopsis sp. H20-H5]